MSAVIEGKGGFRAWLNKRLPVDQFVADQLTGLLRAEELQHLVLLRLAGAAGVRHADRDGHLHHHALQAG